MSPTLRRTLSLLIFTIFNLVAIVVLHLGVSNKKIVFIGTISIIIIHALELIHITHMQDSYGNFNIKIPLPPKPTNDKNGHK